MKDYEIEILEEWDPMYGTFLFCALKYRKPFNSDALPVQRVGLPGRFAVYIGTAECFLSYFFEKYFNRNLSYNVVREDVEDLADKHGIMWNMDNYYTREEVETMCEDILKVAQMLKGDYDNSSLNPIKERFRLYEMVSEDDPDYDSGTDADIPKHIDNVIDFYERFVARMRKMLQMNPDASVILFEGP